MTGPKDTDERGDPYDLNRFVRAQQGVIETVMEELKSGRKRSHWMWFIFPQFEGLGHTPTSMFYSIKSVGEARSYLEHPVLGTRLRECTEAVLSVEGRTASDIFGYPDDMKLKSSMTLFAHVSNDPDSVFFHVIEKYYRGESDARTLRLLGQAGSG